MSEQREIHDTMEITAMQWQGIYLHVTVRAEGDHDLTAYEFALTDKAGKKVFPLKTVDMARRELVVNITNLGGGRMAQNGVWYFRYRRRDGGAEWRDLPITLAVGGTLADLDKVYRYGGTAYAYVMTFAIEQKGDALLAPLTVTYMAKSDDPDKRYFRAESSRVAARAQKRLIWLLETLINGVYQVMSRITPKRGHRVLLMSESRVPMNGNLKALDDRIKARGLDKSDLKMSYWFQKTLEVNRFKILLIWLRLTFVTARQDIIFIDDYTPFFNHVKVNPKTKLIQVWHAGVGFKLVGYGRFGTEGSPKPQQCCYRQLDYAIVGGRALCDIYAEVFGLDSERCLPYGLMRLDGYLDPARVEAFRAKFYQDYPALAGKRLILFAPTFRGASQRTSYYPYEMLDWGKIYEVCGEDSLFLIKQHPFIPKQVEIPPQYADRIMDFSSFPDINDLFYVTDILITDYSSNIYEFSLHHKPMIFFIFDEAEYALTRGVHRSVEEHAPGKLCRTFDEVLTAIREEDFEIEKVERFIEGNFDMTEGLATDKVIDNLILKKKHN